MLAVGGGVQGRHRAALANTGRAVGQGGQGGGSSRVAAWSKVVRDIEKYTTGFSKNGSTLAPYLGFFEQADSR